MFLGGALMAVHGQPSDVVRAILLEIRSQCDGAHISKVGAVAPSACLILPPLLQLWQYGRLRLHAAV